MSDPLVAIEHKKRLDACFDTLVHCAKNNLRCPERNTHGLTYPLIHALILAGKIRVLISTRNYRTVEILVGEAMSKCTAPDPSGAKPWKIIDVNGTRTSRGLKERRQPPKITLPEISI